MIVHSVLLLLFVPPSYNLLVITDTVNGQVRGHRVSTHSDGYLDMYLGIPFAEAPVGKLRFAPPREKASWRYSFGKSYSNVDEDCLYLNVFSPKNANNPNHLFPVMVWVHGGSFRYGSGSEYDGRLLASRGGVIVVTINYRLGALGFLSTDDSVTSGNQGLLDQVLALKWVNRNIRYFGGNPDQVTLFGQSAGGAAVSLHMFSPLSEGGYDVSYYNSLLDDWSSRFLHSSHIKSAVTCYYAPTDRDDRENVQTFMQLKSDYGYIIPQIKLAFGLNTQGSKTWLYDFNYRSQNYPEPSWMGVPHAAELYYLFGSPLSTSEPCPEDPSITCPQIWKTYQQWNQLDSAISKTVIDVWSNFAKMGNNNASSMRLPSGAVWNVFNSKKQFLFIGNSLQFQTSPRQRQLPLWNSFDYLSYYANPTHNSSKIHRPVPVIG